MATEVQGTQQVPSGLGSDIADGIEIGRKLERAERLESFADVVSDRFIASEISLVQAQTQVSARKGTLEEELLKGTGFGSIAAITAKLQGLQEDINGFDSEEIKEIREHKKQLIERSRLFKLRKDTNAAITADTKTLRKDVTFHKDYVARQDSRIVNDLTELGKWVTKEG